MYALDNSSGVTTMPVVKNQQFQPNAPRWFTEGGNGVAPSYPGADWFNIVQAELLGVLTEAHITPDKNNLTQLAQAVKKIIMDNTTTFTALHDLFIGVPIPYPLSTVPTGCLAMNGQRFDTRRYPKLAQKYPSGQLPDMRGEFIRGWDNGRGVDTGRALLSAQGDAFQDHVHFLPTVGGDSYEWESDISVFIWDNTSNKTTEGAFVHKSAMATGKQGNNHSIKEGGEVRTYHASKVPSIVANSYRQRVANETRPRNIAYHYICLAA